MGRFYADILISILMGPSRPSDALGELTGTLFSLEVSGITMSYPDLFIVILKPKIQITQLPELHFPVSQFNNTPNFILHNVLQTYVTGIIRLLLYLFP